MTQPTWQPPRHTPGTQGPGRVVYAAGAFNPPTEAELATLTPATLAAHWRQFARTETVSAYYGVSRKEQGLIVKGDYPIINSLALIYWLLTRYPTLMPQPPVTLAAFQDILASHGVTDPTFTSQLLTHTRRPLNDALADEATGSIVARLMTAIAQLLEHYPLAVLWTVRAAVIAQPPGGHRLNALENGRSAFQVMDLTGVAASRYARTCRRRTLPFSLAFLVMLLTHYPEHLAPPVTVAGFDALMKAHGVTHSAQVSALLGRLRQTWQFYCAGERGPTGPTGALMQLIARFLETHPLAEYIALAHAVTGWPGATRKAYRPR